MYKSPKRETAVPGGIHFKFYNYCPWSSIGVIFILLIEVSLSPHSYQNMYCHAFDFDSLISENVISL